MYLLEYRFLGKKIEKGDQEEIEETDGEKKDKWKKGRKWGKAIEKINKREQLWQNR